MRDNQAWALGLKYWNVPCTRDEINRVILIREDTLGWSQVGAEQRDTVYMRLWYITTLVPSKRATSGPIFSRYTKLDHQT